MSAQKGSGAERSKFMFLPAYVLVWKNETEIDIASLYLIDCLLFQYLPTEIHVATCYHYRFFQFQIILS